MSLVSTQDQQNFKNTSLLRLAKFLLPDQKIYSFLLTMMKEDVRTADMRVSDDNCLFPASDGLKYCRYFFESLLNIHATAL